MGGSVSEISHAMSVLSRHSTTRVLPVPDGPTSMSEWRTSDISYVWMILSTHVSIGCRLSSGRRFSSDASTALCFIGAALRPGKRSSMSERKSGTSSATNLDRFMSRSVRMRSMCSDAVRSSRFEPPAVRSTARMLRSPKS